VIAKAAVNKAAARFAWRSMIKSYIPIAAAMALAVVPTASAGAGEAPPGAAACSGCHPATAGVETPVPPLAGRDPEQIASAMRAFRSGQQTGTVMNRIAKGFSDDEIQAIAAWYGGQK
jgi:sulfide dehydrogenase cytochrome subunit